MDGTMTTLRGLAASVEVEVAVVQEAAEVEVAVLDRTGAAVVLREVVTENY